MPWPLAFMRSDLPDGQVARFCVGPAWQKFTARHFAQVSSCFVPFRLNEQGRFANVTNAGRDAVDAEGLLT
jgi:hypothetical protein